MNNYTLTLCLVVFILLFIVFTFLAGTIYSLAKRLILSGADDTKIYNELSVRNNKKESKVGKIIRITLLIILWIILIGIFSINIFTTVKANNVIGGVPVLKTVDSGSMSAKYEGNRYLFENKLDNQLQVNDLVVLRKLPAEKDIKKYDIILYEYDGVLILHRVVDIKEPTEDREYRLFVFQGDNVKNRDREDVKYSQMKGIYLNEKVAGIGAFARFMQTPPGYLCFALAFVICICGPFFIEKLEKFKQERYNKIKRERANL